MERIKFRCPSCSKALAIDPQHAGKLVACPECRTQVTVPAESTVSTRPAEGALPTAPTAPVNPFASEAPAAVPSGPTTSPYAIGTPAASIGTTSGGIPQQQGTTKTTSMGKSIFGLIVAMLVAGVFTVLWLVIAAVAGYELGILAWAMGGAVGLGAGAIGRNPSPIYCGLTAAIAVMSVLAAKGIMVAALMALSWGADLAMDFVDLSPEQQKLAAAMADQMLIDGEFNGIEKQYAEAYVSAYFAGGDVYDVMTDEMYEVADQVDEKVQTQLDMKTPQEQEQLCLAARARHPEWIEDNNQYLAIVDQMQNDETSLSDELAAHAAFQLGQLDDSWDDEYSDSVSADEFTDRQAELRKLAAERINGMDESQRDQVVRDALGRHLSWNPYPDAHHAVLEKMSGEGAFTGLLAEHAKATIEYEMTDGYPDYFDEIADDEFERRDEELRIAVNERLVSLDSAARAAMIEETKSRYPDWYGESTAADADQQELQEILDEIGTDGTWKGSFLAVFGLMDLLWLFLGATTAYGTARKYGASA